MSKYSIKPTIRFQANYFAASNAVKNANLPSSIESNTQAIFKKIITNADCGHNPGPSPKPPIPPTPPSPIPPTPPTPPSPKPPTPPTPPSPIPPTPPTPPSPIPPTPPTPPSPKPPTPPLPPTPHHHHDGDSLSSPWILVGEGVGLAGGIAWHASRGGRGWPDDNENPPRRNQGGNGAQPNEQPQQVIDPNLHIDYDNPGRRDYGVDVSVEEPQDNNQGAGGQHDQQLGNQDEKKPSLHLGDNDSSDEYGEIEKGKLPGHSNDFRFDGKKSDPLIKNPDETFGINWDSDDEEPPGLGPNENHIRPNNENPNFAENTGIFDQQGKSEPLAAHDKVEPSVGVKKPFHENNLKPLQQEKRPENEHPNFENNEGMFDKTDEPLDRHDVDIPSDKVPMRVEKFGSMQVGTNAQGVNTISTHYDSTWGEKIKVESHALITKNNELVKIYNTTVSQLDNINKELSELKKDRQQNEISDQVKELNTKKSTLTKEINRLKTKIDSVRADYNKVNDQYKPFKEDREALEDMFEKHYESDIVDSPYNYARDKDGNFLDKNGEVIPNFKYKAGHFYYDGHYAYIGNDGQIINSKGEVLANNKQLNSLYLSYKIDPETKEQVFYYVNMKNWKSLKANPEHYDIQENRMLGVPLENDYNQYNGKVKIDVPKGLGYSEKEVGILEKQLNQLMHKGFSSQRLGNLMKDELVFPNKEDPHKFTFISKNELQKTKYSINKLASEIKEQQQVPITWKNDEDGFEIEKKAPPPLANVSDKDMQKAQNDNDNKAEKPKSMDEHPGNLGHDNKRNDDDDPGADGFGGGMKGGGSMKGGATTHQQSQTDNSNQQEAAKGNKNSDQGQKQNSGELEHQDDLGNDQDTDHHTTTPNIDKQEKAPAPAQLDAGQEETENPEAAAKVEGHAQIYDDNPAEPMSRSEPDEHHSFDDNKV